MLTEQNELEKIKQPEYIEGDWELIYSGHIHYNEIKKEYRFINKQIEYIIKGNDMVADRIVEQLNYSSFNNSLTDNLQSYRPITIVVECLQYSYISVKIYNFDKSYAQEFNAGKYFRPRKAVKLGELINDFNIYKNEHILYIN